MEHAAVVAGGTGLVGSTLLATLDERPAWGDIHALVRRPVDLEGKRTRTHVVDFASLDATTIPEGVHAAFCALGTTIKKAGTKAAFRAVDHDAVLAFARACRERGVPQFHCVSAIGADAHSRVFYNRVKGETEEALKRLGFSALVLYRPSLLLGDRREKRPGEEWGARFERVVRPLLVGPLRPYRGIDASSVALAMARCAERGASGIRTLRSDEIARLGATGGAP